ncbi:MAG: hypoxanthine phosphoribosyltransferase [Candidatus Cloacimonetes bacterium]|nr:hypoxanthine phosphoribosyltransferase [Candidatus Cloacimonadota bacterium]
MHPDLKDILIPEHRLQKRLQELALQLKSNYADKEPVIIGILKGAAIFLSDIVRLLDFPVQIDFMALSSYGTSTKSSGVVKIRKDIDIDILNRHVIVIEDIVDSGLTLQYIIDYLKKHHPLSVSVCALLDKPEAHKTDIRIDYLGFEIENAFVVGYGLDYSERYRNLPYIGILKKEIYT